MMSSTIRCRLSMHHSLKSVVTLVPISGENTSARAPPSPWFPRSAPLVREVAARVRSDSAKHHTEVGFNRSFIHISRIIDSTGEVAPDRIVADCPRINGTSVVEVLSDWSSGDISASLLSESCHGSGLNRVCRCECTKARRSASQPGSACTRAASGTAAM